MSHFDWKTMAIFGVASASVFAAGCAQDVGDIDRTQPNKLEKKDFTGVWYINQTAVDVPARDPRIFVGVATGIEKIRWEIQESMLFAYRAYEFVPGHDQEAGDKTDGETDYREGSVEGQNKEYKEQPIAAFRIVSHFDVQRSYNSATGEQTNVIVENGSDRPWYERSQMRVDWSRNLISTGFSGFERFSDTTYFVQDSDGTVDSLYTERDNKTDALTYFDFTNRITNGANDVKVRYSFSKLENYERDYQPLYYDDDMMTKFGYFRTERYVYDRRFGFQDRKMLRLANRHDIWKNDFKLDSEGEFVRDAEGRRIPTPMVDRIPKPVVYHMSPNYPESMKAASQQIADDFDRTYSRTVGAVKNLTEQEVAESYGRMFILCDSDYETKPEGEMAACDIRPASAQVDANGDYIPFSARPGDLRVSFFFWVEQPQAAGPLGFGPSHPDPETGEIISGSAYIYGASIDTYAQSSLNQIRFANGDFSDEDIRDGDDIDAQIRQRFDRVTLDPRASTSKGISSSLSEVDLRDAEGMFLRPEIMDRIERLRNEGFESISRDVNYRERINERLKDAGFDQMMLDQEVLNTLGHSMALNDNTFDFDPTNPSTSQVDAILKDFNPLDMQKKVKERQEHRNWAAENNIFLAEFADAAIVGTAKKYKGRDDYDAIWQELRENIFKGVMAHEVGHTVGLRHNFQGSYDSLNFFDSFWELQAESLPAEPPTSVKDFYELPQLTDKQIDGEMTTMEYSSIMDYHSRFNGDFSGLGKYDDAAILFAYSSGTYKDIEEDNTEAHPVEMGYVEVFDDSVRGDRQLKATLYQTAPTARLIFHSREDRFAPSQHLLNDFHYTVLVDALGGPENLKKRSLMRYSELESTRQPFLPNGEENPNYLEIGDANRPIEVPYMFCSDEWASNIVNCARWDMGKDPYQIVQRSIQRYYEYYPFRNFRRGNLNFNTLSAAYSSLRTFDTMPMVYQQWLFNSGGPDYIHNNAFRVAAFAGINFLKDVATLPQYGSYFEDEAGNLELQSFDADAQFVNNQDQPVEPDLRVYPGEGRVQYTRFDLSRGYYYWMYPREAGHFWESYFAMLTLSSTSTTAILGQDVGADVQSFILPYALVFGDELTSVFNGFFTRDMQAIAPRVIDGKLAYAPMVMGQFQTSPNAVVNVDPYTGSDIDMTAMNSAQLVNIPINFNQRVFGMVNAMASFGANFQRSFVDQSRVFKIGGGHTVTPGPDFEVISFTDPISGVTYGALHSLADTEYKELGASLVKRGQDLEAQYNSSNNADDRATIRREQDGLVQDINIASAAVEIFDRAL